MKLELLGTLLLAAGCSLPPIDDPDGGGTSSGEDPTDAGTGTLGGTTLGTTTTAATTDGTDTDDPTTTGEPTTTDGTDTDAPPPEDECWDVDVLVDDPSRSPARGLAAQGDGLVLAGSPSFDDVGAVAFDGAPQWSYGGFSPSEDLPLRMHEAVPRGEGSFAIAGQLFAPELASNESLWIAEVDADGALAWERVLGPSHYMVWVDIDLRAHPAGGFVVSSHDSLDGGASPRLLTIRLDDLGQTVWSNEHPLPGDPPIAINWAMGAMDLLPSGDIVQLTSATEGLRVLRTTADGDVVWDQTYATATWPQDLVALPDGDVLVLSMDLDDADLLRLDGDGAVQWEQRYHFGPSSNLSSMAWDPLSERLLAVGSTRGIDDGPKSMWERNWILVLDGDGVVRWSHVGEPGTPGYTLDVVRDPATTRFFFSKHEEGLYIGEVEPCPT